MTQSPDHRRLPLFAALLALPLAGLAAPIELENASFDAPGDLPGWHAVGHAQGQSHEFAVDRERHRSAPASARIKRTGPEPWGLLVQVVKVQPAWAGKTVRFSGYLRTAGATGTGAGLTLQATTGGGAILVHDHMDDRRVRGEQDWKRVSAQIKVPAGAFYLKTGVILEDDGTLWADDLQLELVD
jgi:hypothetical protein